MAQIFWKFVSVIFVFFLLGYSATYSSQKGGAEPNQFGAFLGSFDKWSAYITPPGEKETTFCHLTKASQDTNKIVASFKYGDQRDFDQRLRKGVNSNFKGTTFEKIKELLRQVCVLKNTNYSIKNAKADFVLCARDEPTGRLVLWGQPGLTKEGFFSVDNKVIDGMVFISGNGHRGDYYTSISGGEGKRYLDMYKTWGKEIYSQILLEYAADFWYDCDEVIEASMCRQNFKQTGFDDKFFYKIFTAADGLWSRQFCKK